MTHLRVRLHLTLRVLVLCISATAVRAQYLEKKILVGYGPLHVLWNPTSDKVYVANIEDGTVTIIDGRTNQVLTTVPVGDSPAPLCWNSLDNKVYVTCREPDWIYVIDGTGDSVINKIRTRGNPTYMAYNAAMNKLYVQYYGDYMVRVYDCSADTLVAEVWLGTLPGRLLWHPVSNRVFCSLYGDSVITIDCASDEVIERVDVGGPSWAMCRNPVSNLVYVECEGGVRVLTASGDSVVGVIPNCGGDMTYAPYPNKIFAVTSAWTYVIDCDLQAVLESLPCYGYVVTCDTMRGKVYTAARSGSYVLDARADSLLLMIPLDVGDQDCIAWNSTDSRVYIAGDGVPALCVIRDTTTAVAEPVADTIGANPRVPTMCRGRLRLGGHGAAALFDLTGRQVALLDPGDNDLRSLRSGVYFVREEPQAASLKPQAIRKVVLTR